MAIIDTEVLFELWFYILRQGFRKGKMEAAERIIKLCDEYGYSKTDIEEMVENDKILETAFDIYYQG